MNAYTPAVVAASSDGLGWTGLRLVAAREPSAVVEFAAFKRNLINVTLTGTLRHETRMEGVVDARPTEPDDVLFVPRGASGVFDFEASGAEEQTLIAEFDDDLFTIYTTELVDDAFTEGGLTPRAHTPAPAVAALVKLLGRELEPSRSRGRMFAESVVRVLALELAASAWTRKPARSRRAPALSPAVRRARDLMETRFAENLSLTELAGESGLSVWQLTRAFRRAFGKTPYAYLLDRRVRFAVERLRFSTDPIASVADEAGFADQQHMTAVFRKRLGAAPGAIRRS